MILILIPRKPERLYIIYDKNDNDCKSIPFDINTNKGSYYICDQSKFIYLKKNLNKESKTLNLSEIDEFKIIPKNELLINFENEIVNREKNELDLLSRQKVFEFNMIILDSTSNNFKIIPVNRIMVLSTNNLNKL